MIISKHAVESVLDKYYREGRAYHNDNHIIEMLMILDDKISQSEIDISKEEQESLELAILYHDSIYDPKRDDNEEKSCNEFLNKCAIPATNKNLVCSLIMVTKTHEYGLGEIYDIMIDLDLYVFQKDINHLIEYEHKIFKEFQHVPIEKYIIGRVSFLRTLFDKMYKSGRYQDHVMFKITTLIEYIQTRKYNIGVYPVLFKQSDPTHINAILKKSESIFDRVIIVVNENVIKEFNKFKPHLNIEDNEVIVYSKTINIFTEPGLVLPQLENITLILASEINNTHSHMDNMSIIKTIHKTNPRIKTCIIHYD